MFGFSYAPDDDAFSGPQAGTGGCRGGCAFDAGTGVSDNDQPNQHHFIEAAMNFVRSINGVDLAFDLGVGHGFLEKQSRSANQDRLGKGRTVVTAGYNIGYAGWVIGGAFAWDNKGLQGPNSRYDATFGVTYETGPWLVGFSVAYTIAKDGQALQPNGALNRRGNDTLFYSEIGGSYKLGPGINLFSVINVARWSGNGTAIEESTGVAWSSGIQINY